MLASIIRNMYGPRVDDQSQIHMAKRIIYNKQIARAAPFSKKMSAMSLRDPAPLQH